MRGRSPYAIRQYEKTNGVERKENVVANLQDELSNLKATVGVDGETAAEAGDSGDTDAATAPNAEHNTADEAEKGTDYGSCFVVWPTRSYCGSCVLLLCEHACAAVPPYVLKPMHDLSHRLPWHFILFSPTPIRCRCTVVAPTEDAALKEDVPE